MVKKIRMSINIKKKKERVITWGKCSHSILRAETAVGYSIVTGYYLIILLENCGFLSSRSKSSPPFSLCLTQKQKKNSWNISSHHLSLLQMNPNSSSLFRFHLLIFGTWAFLLPFCSSFLVYWSPSSSLFPKVASFRFESSTTRKRINLSLDCLQEWVKSNELWLSSLSMENGGSPLLGSMQEFKLFETQSVNYTHSFHLESPLLAKWYLFLFLWLSELLHDWLEW